MRFENSFTLSVAADDAWTVLHDVERIAPCIPGAELQEVTDGAYRGVLKVRLGAMTAEYGGALRVTEVDEVGRRVILQAQGRETLDQEEASASVSITVHDAGESQARVEVQTDLIVAGRVAELGRGVLADTSASLVADIARCIEREVLGATGTASRRTVASDTEVVADEVADVAMEDPERAAQLVAAVGQSRSAPSGTVPPGPTGPSYLPTAAGGAVAERAVPAAIVGVLLLQVLPKGRVKRLALAVLGSALVAGLVAGKQQRQQQR